MIRRKSIWAAFVLSTAAVCASGPAIAQRAEPNRAGKVEQVEEISLSIGETKMISARDIRNYSEGAGDLIDIRLTSDTSQFVVLGKKSGTTTLLLIKNDGSSVTYSVTVYPKSPAIVEKELNQLLDGMGLKLRRIGARFFIEGRVQSESHEKAVQRIAAVYPGQVESLVSTGSGPVERKTLIRIDFYFAQFDKASNYGVGVGWPAQIGGDTIVQNQFVYDFVAGATKSATATVVNQPLPHLDIAARNGWAKVFKHSTVITANGSEATFENGGEQNFLTNTGLAITLQKVQFGANVTVLPIFDPATRELDVKIDANIADLTPGISTPIPGRNTAKLSTLVHMKIGQSVVLSGIRTSAQKHDVTGIPLLSEIPVLGVLFGSHADQKTEVEGAILVVPSVVDSVSKPAQQVIDAALEQYKDYHGDISKMNTFDRSPRGAR